MTGTLPYVTLSRWLCAAVAYRTQVNFTVAVDFTGSNGDPHDPDSLHFMDSYGLNEYATAILAIGNIVQDYDR